VMLDFQLAELYEVETRMLNQAVKRNINRFPNDFMIQLSTEEWSILKSQFVISKMEKRGGTQKLPYAFTEQGVAMLSSVLKSKKAIDVNIAIMRAFVMLRQHLADYQDLKNEINILEKEMNRKFKDINEALHYLLSPKSKPIEIGFKQKARSKK
jgi:ORF6N domain